MQSYSEIIQELVNELTTNPEDVSRIVADEAEKFRGDYYRIADCGEDELDSGELNDFFDELRESVAYALRVLRMI